MPPFTKAAKNEAACKNLIAFMRATLRASLRRKEKFILCVLRPD
jgi:hypothetical protein